MYRALGLQAPGRDGGGRACLSWGDKAVLWSVFLTSWPSGITPTPNSGPPPHTHSLPLHSWPISGLRSSNRSSSGAGSSCGTGGGFFFRSFLSFPVAKMFWSLCFSFSRSPVKAQKWLNYGVKGTPTHGMCS